MTKLQPQQRKKWGSYGRRRHWLARAEKKDHVSRADRSIFLKSFYAMSEDYEIGGKNYGSYDCAL